MPDLLDARRFDPNSKHLLFLGDAQEIGMIKTAVGLARFRPERCVGEFALPEAAEGLTAGVEPTSLDSCSLEEGLVRGADSLVVGLATSGGALAPQWIEPLARALELGYDLISGLHQPLSSEPKLVELAARHGRRLIDLRAAPKDLDVGTGRPRPGKRLLTVGTDCAVGKMFTALQLETEFRRRGLKATFRATGQTGILIAGDGIAVDAVLSDFVSGAAEQLSPANDPDHWDLIEGQGSLLHPSFAAVTMGLVHGAAPDVMVLCHDPRRVKMRGKVDHQVPSLQAARSAHESAAHLTNPEARVVACSVITKGLDPAARDTLLRSIEDDTGLVAGDPLDPEDLIRLADAALGVSSSGMGR